MKPTTDDDAMIREEDAAITAENLRMEAEQKAKAEADAKKAAKTASRPVT